MTYKVKNSKKIYEGYVYDSKVDMFSIGMSLAALVMDWSYSKHMYQKYLNNFKGSQGDYVTGCQPECGIYFKGCYRADLEI